MNGAALSHVRLHADVWVAAAAVAAAGCGCVFVFAGAASDRTEWLVAGGVMLATGVLVVLAGGWIDGLSLLALSLPLPALYGSDVARLAPATGVAALVVAAWVLHPGRTAPRLGALPIRSALVFFLAFGVAGLFAPSRGSAIREVVSLGALLAVLLVVTDELGRRWARAEALARSIAIAGGLAGVLAILETFAVLPGRFPLTGTPFYRAAGGFGWPNELGMFFALSVPFAVHAWRTAPPGLARTFTMGLLVLTGGGLIATFSRGSWVTVLVAPGALLFTGQGRLVTRFWVAAVLGGVVFDVASGGLVSGRIAAAVTDPSAIQRLAIMAAGVLMFLESPLVGVGPGGFGDALERVGPQVTALFDFVGSAHNTYIHMAAETGILGLTTFVAFLWVAFRVALRSAREGRTSGTSHTDADLRLTILWSFTTACLVCLFEWTLVQGVGHLIMLIIAMASAAPKLRESPA